VTSFNPRLLTPPEEEEIYPYRRVWRSLIVEAGILFALTAILFVLVNFLRVRVPENFVKPISAALALVPLGLWLAASWLQERFVPEPRQRLAVVVIVSALLANAVGVPLVNEFLQVDRWLPLSSALSRFLGYTFTVGIVQEMLKYLVLRYVVWPDCFRTRLDGVAYALASAVGYVTVLNLHYVFSNPAPPDVTALRIFNVTIMQFATSAIVGYGLAELRFGRPSPLLLTFTLALAATVTGITIPLRSGLVNASLVLNVSATSPLRGIGLSLAALVGIAIAVGFLIENAERQDREAAAGREV
jgi:RsiW-degrading membrane proteinase PrsW (M82 family)